MFNFHRVALAKKICEATDADFDKIKKAINEYMEDWTFFSWATSDVLNRAEGKLTREEAKDLLDIMLDEYSSEEGMNWSIIDHYIENYAECTRNRKK